MRLLNLLYIPGCIPLVLLLCFFYPDINISLVPHHVFNSGYYSFNLASDIQTNHLFLFLLSCLFLLLIFTHKTLSTKNNLLILVYAICCILICSKYIKSLLDILVLLEIAGICSFFLLKDRSSVLYLTLHTLSSISCLVGILYIHKDISLSSIAFIFFFMINSPMFPFCIWLPNIYPKSEPSINIALQMFNTKTILYILSTHVYLIPESYHSIMYCGGLITLIYGFVYLIKESNIRKMLSYTTVGYSGIITMLIFSGIDISKFLITSMTAHACLYMCASNIIRDTKQECFNKIPNKYYQHEKLEFYVSLIALSSMLSLPFTQGYGIKILFQDELNTICTIAYSILSTGCAFKFIQTFFQRNNIAYPETQRKDTNYNDAAIIMMSLGCIINPFNWIEEQFFVSLREIINIISYSGLALILIYITNALNKHLNMFEVFYNKTKQTLAKKHSMYECMRAKKSTLSLHPGNIYDSLNVCRVSLTICLSMIILLIGMFVMSYHV